MTNAKAEAMAMRKEGMGMASNDSNVNAAKSLKAMLKSGQQPSAPENPRKRPAPGGSRDDDDDEPETPDEVLEPDLDQVLD